MGNKRTCALCSAEYEPAELSHIVPNFVYRWLMATSTTPFMRFGGQMNRRAQDGIKAHFLCCACEDRFEKHENRFASEVFKPFAADNCYTTEHGQYMLQFAVSVSWRVLAYVQENHGLDHFRGRHAVAVADTLATWQDYLLDRTQEIGVHEIHLVPFCGVIEHTCANVPNNINRYLRRAVEIDVGVSDTQAFTYTKLGPMIFIGLIKYPDLAHWQNTKIEKTGRFPPMNFTVPGSYQGYIFARSKRMAELEAQISDRQKAKIEESYEKNRNRFEESDTYKTLLMDLDLQRKGKR